VYIAEGRQPPFLQIADVRVFCLEFGFFFCPLLGFPASQPFHQACCTIRAAVTLDVVSLPIVLFNAILVREGRGLCDA
jgi:hypothetical protein